MSTSGTEASVPATEKPVRTATGRSASDVLAWGRELTEPALRDAVDTMPASMRQIVGYHFGWWDDDGRPTGSGGGKGIRPTLVLLTAEAVRGDATNAVPAAVAVELVHNFSLLHDDVIDGDATRRHRPTAWRVFGLGAAVLAGDALLTLALDVLGSSGHPAAHEGMHLLNTAVLSMVYGQAADVSFEHRADVGMLDCLSMAERKTGALMGCACALGALFGGAPAQQVEHLRCAGEHLGLAFQLVDDLLDIWGNPAVTGKPVYSDLANRKKSVPVVAALTSCTAAGRELSALYHRDEPLSDGELARAAELVDRAGGRAWSQARVDDLIEQALARLRSANPSVRSAAELDALIRRVTGRSC
jgi:geranylgeranyl diphosphate synthase type I